MTNVRCPYCGHLVLKVDKGTAESDCRGCGSIIRYSEDTKKLKVVREPRRSYKNRVQKVPD